ncbi:MAG: integrase [Bradyrhizobium sp.]|nr:MAG: integrase [Bradyrhizobium sp.]
MNSLTALLGGSPAGVALRLFVVSFIVGLVLVTFGFDPGDIIDSFVSVIRHLIDYGLTDIRQIGRVLATGALVVLPVWLVLRLLDARRAR